MKRAFDIVLTLLFAPVALALAAPVALAVLIALGRPVFFRQERAGLRGRPFLIVKFRTMREGSETDAERLGRFGRFLRATSLDELPELWNVLRGDMSLVGPRPLPTRYLPRYTPEQARRHEVRPGITGWAQIHGRNALSWEEKFRYDVEYVDRRSLLLDLRILALTAFQVVFPRHISHPGKATLFSILVPGLGQIYNHEYWKLPIYLGAIGFAVHYYADCQTNYLRFKNIYQEASDPTSGYDGPISADQALYYRNVYRRYRDYSVLAIAVLYLLQVIDANVFSYMHNFEVDDDLALRVAPAVIMPERQFASISPVNQQTAFGLRLGISF